MYNKHALEKVIKMKRKNIFLNIFFQDFYKKYPKMFI